MVNAILATIPSTMFDGGVKKASAVYPGQSFTINFYAQKLTSIGGRTYKGDRTRKCYAVAGV